MPSNGLLYPPASVEDIPFVTRPISEGGVLERKGMVEVISSLEADGRKIPYDIRMGVWVTVEGETEYIKNCFEEYNAHTDPSGRYFTLYKRWHLIGLEVGMSVASVALRGEATGVATCWNADVVATAKRDLKPGEMLDGEGGYTVWGKLLPAETSSRMGGLPLGLAHDVKVVRPVKKGQSLSWADVAMDTTTAAYKVRARDGGAVRDAAAEDRVAVIDLLIRGAELFDGSGAPPQRADVAVVDGRIARIAPRIGDAEGARRIVEADGLALMPGIVDSHTHFDAQITWDPTLSPSPALGVTTAVIGNCGFTIAPCRPADRELTMRNLTQVEGMSIDGAQPRHRLGLRDLSRIPGAAARRRLGGQRRRLRRPFVGAHLGDGRRRGEARSHAPTRSRRCRRSCARRWPHGAVGFASSTSPAHNGEGGLPMPSRLASDAEMAALVGAMGEGGRGVYMLTKGGHTPMPFLESLAAATRPAGDGRRAAAQQRQPDARCSPTSMRSPRRTRAAGGCSARCRAARCRWTSRSPRPIRSKASRAGSRRSACAGAALEAVLADPDVSRRRARRAGDADDLSPLQQRVGQGPGGRDRAAGAAALRAALDRRDRRRVRPRPARHDARPGARRRPEDGVHRACC